MRCVGQSPAPSRFTSRIRPGFSGFHWSELWKSAASVTSLGKLFQCLLTIRAFSSYILSNPPFVAFCPLVVHLQEKFWLCFLYSSNVCSWRLQIVSFLSYPFPPLPSLGKASLSPSPPPSLISLCTLLLIVLAGFCCVLSCLLYNSSVGGEPKTSVAQEHKVTCHMGIWITKYRMCCHPFLVSILF